METMTALFTRAQYDQLPEGFPAELIDGMLVKEPAPTYGHQYVGSRIHVALTALVGPDLALMAPADVVIDKINVFQPDLLVLAKPGDPAKSNVGIPRLAIEIVSPTTRERDREYKCRRLLGAGVAEVWIVDPEERVIELWTTEGMYDARGDAHVRSRALRGFSLSPEELFSPPK